MNLRPYQLECLEAIKDAHTAGINRVLVALPTGTGKTVIIAHLLDALKNSKKMMVLAHREELLDQARDKILQAYPHLRVAIEQGDRKADPRSDVIVASVPTLGRPNSKRIEKFRPEEFGILVCDEAHHAVASSYLNIFLHFGLPQNKNILLVGVTATPKRGDGIGLETVFDEIVYQKDIKTMIREKYLCPITGYRMYTGTDISSVRTELGDFEQKELSGAVNNSMRNALVVKSYLEKTGNQKGIVFTVDMQHAHELAELFNEASIPCAAITGEMERNARRRVIEAFRQNKLKVLTNCQVLIEGFDEPAVEVVIMARPTTSGLLYTQMVGRGTRLYPGKKKLTVIDLVDNYAKHSLVNLPTLFGMPPDFDLMGKDLLFVNDRIEKACEKYPDTDFGQVTDLGALVSRLQEVDFFNITTIPDEIRQNSKFVWFKLPGGDYKIFIGKKEYAQISLNLLGKYEITLALNDKPIFSEHKPAFLSTAFAITDSLIRANRPDAVPYLLHEVGWRGEPATTKQIRTMDMLGIRYPENITKGHASMLIGQHFVRK